MASLPCSTFALTPRGEPAIMYAVFGPVEAEGGRCDLDSPASVRRATRKAVDALAAEVSRRVEEHDRAAADPDRWLVFCRDGTILAGGRESYRIVSPGSDTGRGGTISPGAVSASMLDAAREHAASYGGVVRVVTLPG